MIILSLIYNLQIKLWLHVLRIANILGIMRSIPWQVSWWWWCWRGKGDALPVRPYLAIAPGLWQKEIFQLFTWLLTAVHWLWQRPSPSGSFGSGRPISSSTAQPNFKSCESSLNPSKKISPSQTGWGWQNDLACAPGYNLPVQYQTTCRSLGEVEIFPQREFPELLDLLDPNGWFAARVVSCI